MIPTVLYRLALYNIAVLVAFVFVYASILSDPVHFDAPSTDKRDVGSAVYFAVATHTTVGFGDIVAKSNRARAWTMAHLALVFVGMMAIPHFA